MAQDIKHAEVEKNNVDFLTRLESVLLIRRNQDLSKLTAVEQADLIAGRASTILPHSDLEKKLQQSKSSGKPLEIKFGIDPTGNQVHLGHVAPIILLSRLQRMGHKITFVIGDFTASIGDPSGRVEGRPFLSDEKIAQNSQSYIDQVSPFLDINRTVFVKNSQWLNELSAKELTVLSTKINLSQLLQRDEFRQRLEKGSSLTLAETFYALYMGYDSVKLETDIEVSGADQLLNLNTCRLVQKVHGQSEEVAVTCPIILGTNSGTEKMSKSKGNYIALDEPSDQLYGKLMSYPDSDGNSDFGRIEMFLKSLTEISNQEWNDLERMMTSGEINPINVKKMFAHYLTQVIYGASSADESQLKFEQTVQYKVRQNLDEIPKFIVEKEYNVVDLLVASGVATSRSAAKRLIEGNAVRLLDGGQVIGVDDIVHPGTGIKIGKRYLMPILPTN